MKRKVDLSSDCIAATADKTQVERARAIVTKRGTIDAVDGKALRGGNICDGEQPLKAARLRMGDAIKHAAGETQLGEAS